MDGPTSDDLLAIAIDENSRARRALIVARLVLKYHAREIGGEVADSLLETAADMENAEREIWGSNLSLTGGSE